MNIYSYFIKTWQHLKEIFQKSSLVQKNSAYRLRKSKKAYQSSNCESSHLSCESSHLSSIKRGSEFSSQTLRFILKKTKIYSLFKIYFRSSKSFIYNLFHSLYFDAFPMSFAFTSAI